MPKRCPPKLANVSGAGPKSEPLARVLNHKLISRAGLSQAGARVSRDIRRFCQQGEQITRDIPQNWSHKSPNPHLSASFAKPAPANSECFAFGPLARILILKLVFRASLSQSGARVSRDIRQFRQPSQQTNRNISQIGWHKCPKPHLPARFAKAASANHECIARWPQK